MIIGYTGRNLYLRVCSSNKYARILKCNTLNLYIYVHDFNLLYKTCMKSIAIFALHYHNSYQGLIKSMWVKHDSPSRQFPHPPMKINSFMQDENKRIQKSKEKAECHRKYLKRLTFYNMLAITSKHYYLCQCTVPLDIDNLSVIRNCWICMSLWSPITVSHIIA